MDMFKQKLIQIISMGSGILSWALNMDCVPYPSVQLLVDQEKCSLRCRAAQWNVPNLLADEYQQQTPAFVFSMLLLPQVPVMPFFLAENSHFYPERGERELWPQSGSLNCWSEGSLCRGVPQQGWELCVTCLCIVYLHLCLSALSFLSSLHGVCLSLFTSGTCIWFPDNHSVGKHGPVLL